jgi:hypothetical protein
MDAFSKLSETNAEWLVAGKYLLDDSGRQRCQLTNTEHPEHGFPNPEVQITYQMTSSAF